MRSPLEGEGRVSTIAGHSWLPVLAVQASTGVVLGQPHCLAAAGTSACSCLVRGRDLDGRSLVHAASASKASTTRERACVALKCRAALIPAYRSLILGPL